MFLVGYEYLYREYKWDYCFRGPLDEMKEGTTYRKHDLIEDWEFSFDGLRFIAPEHMVRSGVLAMT